ncbi:MAG: Nif11-like leader peptide family natural product precursor [Coleofasciculus sp. S288]|nr:Nif11-like leader peptide family natural product precursor [Coleofasciculus sp. S288]
MSMEAVKQFLERVGQDAALQQELNQAIESAENDRAAAAEVGAKYGYSFSPDEIGQVMEVALTQESGGELNEEELESIAGGFCTGAMTGAVTAAYGGVYRTLGPITQSRVQW